MYDTLVFDSLENGVSLEAVCQQLGEPTCLVSNEIAQMEPGITINTVQSEIYEWVIQDGPILRILFRQDKLSDKVLLNNQEA